MIGAWMGGIDEEDVFQKKMVSIHQRDTSTDDVRLGNPQPKNGLQLVVIARNLSHSCSGESVGEG